MISGTPRLVNFKDTAGLSFNQTPEQAMAFFRAKGLEPTFAWQDMMGREHARAFTVAKMMDVDMLADVRALVDQAINEGKTKAWFSAQLTPYLQQKGWWGKQEVLSPKGGVVQAQLGSPHRLETIFRTNMQSAYAAGQWDQIQAQADLMPYLMYDAIDDHRTRPAHAALDNKVYRVDDPFWQTHYPPNGWNCRCGVIQMTDDMLAESGLVPSKPHHPGTYNWQNPNTGKWYKVPTDLDPGWDYNPGMAYSRHLQKIAGEKIAALPSDMKKAALTGLANAEKIAQEAALKTTVALAQKEAAKAEGAAAFNALKARSQAKASEFAAKKELVDITAGNVPYKSNAYKQLLKQEGFATATPQEQLVQINAKAAKI